MTHAGGQPMHGRRIAVPFRRRRTDARRRYVSAGVASSDRAARRRARAAVARARRGERHHAARAAAALAQPVPDGGSQTRARPRPSRGRARGSRARRAAPRARARGDEALDARAARPRAGDRAGRAAPRRRLARAQRAQQLQRHVARAPGDRFARLLDLERGRRRWRGAAVARARSGRNGRGAGTRASRSRERARAPHRRASHHANARHRRRRRPVGDIARLELAERFDHPADDLAVRIVARAIEHAEQRELAGEREAGVATLAPPLLEERVLPCASDSGSRYSQTTVSMVSTRPSSQ